VSALSLVKAGFCASHKDAITGNLHGHSWEVYAWFAPKVRRDLRVLQQTLATYVSALDHNILDNVFEGSGVEVCDEGIAAWLGDRLANLDCVRVRLWRPVEGIGGEWLA